MSDQDNTRTSSPTADGVETIRLTLRERAQATLEAELADYRDGVRLVCPLPAPVLRDLVYRQREEDARRGGAIRAVAEAANEQLRITIRKGAACGKTETPPLVTLDVDPDDLERT